MSIVNQIAAFGQNTGDGITRGLNEFRRKKEADRNYELTKQRYDIQDKRYQNQLARYAMQDAEAADERERQYLQSGVQAIYKAPPEYRQQAYQGWLEGAQKQGIDLTGVPTEYSDAVLYKMAGSVGANLKPDSKDSPYGKINPGDFTPESLAQFDQTRDFSVLKQNSNSGQRGTPKAFQPEQYTDADGNLKWGIPTFDPATNSVAMKPLEGMAPVQKEKTLSPTVQKMLDESQTQYFDSDRKAREYEVLAGDIQSMSGQFGGGLQAKWTEQYKEMTGNQDAVTDLRRRFYGVRASQAVSNLPPGVASDKDIALALSGFPDEAANAGQVAGFMRGMAKLERLKAEFNSFKSQKISRDGNTRNLIAEWKEHAENSGLYDQGGDDAGGQMQDIPEGYSLMEDATGNKAYVGPHGEIIEAQ